MATAFSSSNEEKWDNSGLFTSTTEYNKEIKLTVDKQLPSWLKGCLYRNGSGQFEINNDPRTNFNHSFDDFAYIQKYNIDGESNKIYFQSSFIKSRTNTEP
ncbi:unnamed protein product, partial [Rotaria sp. Silwood1]